VPRTNKRQRYIYIRAKYSSTIIPKGFDTMARNHGSVNATHLRESREQRMMKTFAIVPRILSTPFNDSTSSKTIGNYCGRDRSNRISDGTVRIRGTTPVGYPNGTTTIGKNEKTPRLRALHADRLERDGRVTCTAHNGERRSFSSRFDFGRRMSLSRAPKFRS